MSEATKNNTEQALDKVNTYLDGYEDRIGLGSFQQTNVSDYMKLTQEKLRKMSPEDCAEAAYLLMQEATFVQHEINKHQAQKDWASAALDRAIAPHLHQYGGKFATYETRKILATKESDYAQQLQAIISRSERFIARLAYIPQHLSKLASTLLDYKTTKMRAG